MDRRAVDSAEIGVAVPEREVDRAVHLLVEERVLHVARDAGVAADPELAEPARARVGVERLYQGILVRLGRRVDDRRRPRTAAGSRSSRGRGRRPGSRRTRSRPPPSPRPGSRRTPRRAGWRRARRPSSSALEREAQIGRRRPRCAPRRRRRSAPRSGASALPPPPSRAGRRRRAGRRTPRCRGRPPAPARPSGTGRRARGRRGSSCASSPGR